MSMRFVHKIWQIPHVEIIKCDLTKHGMSPPFVTDHRSKVRLLYLRRPGVPRLYSVGAPPVQNIFRIRHKVFCLLVRKGEKRSKVQKVGDLSLSSLDVSIIGGACQLRQWLCFVRLKYMQSIRIPPNKLSQRWNVFEMPLLVVSSL